MSNILRNNVTRSICISRVHNLWPFLGTQPTWNQPSYVPVTGLHQADLHVNRPTDCGDVHERRQVNYDRSKMHAL
jgi:hypothetical protein